MDEDEAWHARPCDLARRTFELSDFLVNQLKVVDVGAKYAGKVTYHFACHLRRLGQTDEVETLIQHVEGATYVPLHRQDQCCGFGGSFAVRYPQISGAMVDDKMRCILATGADCVVSHRRRLPDEHRRPPAPRGQTVEVLHLAELLERR